MRSKDWKVIKKIVVHALELKPEEREEFLDEVCKDSILREEIESLLVLENESDEFMTVTAQDYSKDFLKLEEQDKPTLN